MARWNNRQTEDLFKAILLLRDRKEAKAFFRDLLTEAEIIEFGKRWQAAQLLQQNASYAEIVKRTGLSSRTVARVAKWLQHGQGGYQLMLKRVKK